MVYRPSGSFAGRALIGLGVSSGYMAAIKAFTLWFPHHQWPRINGLHLAAGGVGALSATWPVEFACVTQTGAACSSFWRS